MDRYNPPSDESAASIKVVFSDGQTIEVVGMSHFCQCLIKELRALNFNTQQQDAAVAVAATRKLSTATQSLETAVEKIGE